ncbi:DNA repair protein RadC [Aestuariibacter sp. AA17]|uniref:DNA repair protein RadC n=1 Tax=Fluctibacter corallii TaxID=2984329 RepID=A0ABT3ABU5_9ALTE|nr:DNA repair protein RadC [Aestuariibacter sp. AA17]MCV2886151.1 DNA repair protein RadC [Aestuariibacter sp. AA17]
MKLTEWPSSTRPRERLLALGQEKLSDTELLAIVLSSGNTNANVFEVAQGVLSEFGSLYNFVSACQHDFLRASGVGIATYTKVQAFKEIIKRSYQEKLATQSAFESASDTRLFLMSQLREETNEVFAVLYLSSQHHLITFKKLFYGTITSASVHPRVIVQEGLACNAAAVILAHNHPSGVPEPSQADRRITHQIKQALSLVDINLLDHFVIGAGCSVSFAERGIL